MGIEMEMGMGMRQSHTLKFSSDRVLICGIQLNRFALIKFIGIMTRMVMVMVSKFVMVLLNVGKSQLNQRS